MLGTDGDVRWSAWAQPTATIGSMFGALSENDEVALAGECTGEVVLAGRRQPCDHGFLAKLARDGRFDWLRTGPFEGGPLAFAPDGDVVAAPKIGPMP